MLNFETLSGNRYIWDDKTKLFLLFPEIIKKIKDICLIKGFISEEMMLNELRDDFEKDQISFFYTWVKKWNKIPLQVSKPRNYHDLSPDESKEHVLKYGLKNIILNVTEDCNFRCKYCAFSGEYDYRRDHSAKYMTFKTAKKAIDCYMSLIEDGMRYNPLRTPVIGFYGGEPLLNFKLIKQCVNYIKNNYDLDKVRYSLTTNGSLLTKPVAKWLMKHQINLLISLDGPEKEHNRCSVYKDGRGTFNDVMKNISKIMSLNYEKLSILPVYDIKSDLFQMELFFNSKKLPPLAFVASVDNSNNNTYFDQFTDKDYSDHYNHLQNCEKFYLEHIEQCNHPKSVFNQLFGSNIRSDLWDTASLIPKNNIIKYTATCFPGYKISVGVDGTFFVCERVSSFYPIGNVEEGLDYEKIGLLMKEYFEHMDHCSECQIKNRCHRCLKNFENDKELKFASNVCEGIEKGEIAGITNSLNVIEKHPALIDYYSKYKNIMVIKCILNLIQNAT